MKGGRHKFNKKALVLFGAFVVLLAILASIAFSANRQPNDMTFGATFSTQYASYLGFDWQEVYVAGLEELELKHWRIPVYWSDIEPEMGVYQFDDVDWMMDQALEHEAQVTLAIGLKVPRWPECFLPTWAQDASDEELDDHAYTLVQTIVERYRNHEALERWQVENEPFFPFGECPQPSLQRVEQETALVRSLDPNHLIQSTVSGEQSFWLLSANRVDVLGFSLYREVWNPVIGTFVFPHNPSFYTWQRWLTEPFVDRVIVSELQAEPWLSGALYDEEGAIQEYYAAFPAEDLEANVAFAKRIGVEEVYFWGVEWWYYLKENGEPRLWDAGMGLIQMYAQEEE